MKGLGIASTRKLCDFFLEFAWGRKINGRFTFCPFCHSPKKKKSLSTTDRPIPWECRICNRLKSCTSTLDIFIYRSTADRVGTMAHPRLLAPAAFFATLTILSIFSIASVEMRDPLAVTISRMKRMQQKDRDGVADIAPQWMTQRPAGNLTNASKSDLLAYVAGHWQWFNFWRSAANKLHRSIVEHSDYPKMTTFPPYNHDLGICAPKEGESSRDFKQTQLIKGAFARTRFCVLWLSQRG